MPFYEYECPACKYYAEVLQKISDPPIRKCPSCGKSGFKRLISAPVFRLKGSGWYETDFKSDQDQKRNLAGPDREDGKAATEDTGAAKAVDTKTPADGGKPAEGAKPEAKAPVAKPGKALKSAAASTRRSSSTRSAKPAPKRIVKRAARAAARGGRKR